MTNIPSLTPPILTRTMTNTHVLILTILLLLDGIHDCGEAQHASHGYAYDHKQPTL